jgi:hypothetical protein
MFVSEINMIPMKVFSNKGGLSVSISVGSFLPSYVERISSKRFVTHIINIINLQASYILGQVARYGKLVCATSFYALWASPGSGMVPFAIFKSLP